MDQGVYNASVPNVMQYLFRSSVAALAAASRSVHEVAESMKADSRTMHCVPLLCLANIDRR